MKFKYVVVGAGLSGLTMAERIANELDEEVLIIEKRPHIGGNVYDSYKEGILIQNYGPHIFHTNDKEVYEYLSQFTEWHEYVHRVLSYVDGKLVPMPICIDTLNKLYNLDLDEESISAANLDSSVISRIPFRFNHDTRYFEDKYQGMPKEGYTKMCENMINNNKIHILLNTDYKEVIGDIDYEKLIYTGPIDYFYDNKFGKLLYRSLKFVTETYDLDSYQEVAVVNYPNDNDFTRITEFKKLTGQEYPNKTIIMKEYPGFDDEPCYPYPTEEYKNKFKQYKKLMDKENDVIFIGRLAEYKYYNMDAVVRRALDLFKEIEITDDIEL